MTKTSIIILVAFVILASLITSLRFSRDHPLLHGSEAYTHLNAVSLESPRNPSDYFTFISITNLIPLITRENQIAIAILSMLITGTSVFLLHHLLSKLGVNSVTASTATLLYALSPFTLHTATTLTTSGIAVPLLLGGITLTLHKKTVLASILLSSLSLTSPVHAAIGILCIILLHQSFVLSSGPLLTTITAGLLTLPFFQSPRIGFHAILSDIGTSQGVSTFTVLLAILGLALIWKHKSKYYTTYICAVGITVAALFTPDILPYANILISTLAGLALTTIATTKWNLTPLRDLTIILFACGILFSTIASATLIASAQPTSELAQGFTWIATNGPDSTVITDTDNAAWAAYYSKQKVQQFPPESPLWDKTNVKDAATILAKNRQPSDMSRTTGGRTAGRSTSGMDAVVLEHARNATEFGSRHEPPVKDGWDSDMSTNSRTYLAITPEMLNGVVWQRPEQGLHFVITTSESFKKRFTNNHVEIWEFLPSTGLQ